MNRRAAGVLLAAALIAGCSSRTAPEPAQQPAGPESAPPASHGGFAECLSRQGVADPGGPAAVLGPPPGVDAATWDRAMAACSSLAPGPAGS